MGGARSPSKIGSPTAVDEIRQRICAALGPRECCAFALRGSALTQGRAQP